MKKMILIFLVFSIFNLAKAQILITQKVTDCKTNEPIPFVSIGILGQNMGTITDEKGVFSLQIPKNFVQDSLTFSSIGFETKRLNIKNIKTDLQLCPQTTQLPTLTISSKPRKEKILGLNRTGSAFYMLSCDLKGQSMAARILNRRNIYAKKIGLYVNENKSDSVKMRVTFYKAEKDKIGEIINTESLIWTIKQPKTGWLNYDLPQVLPIEGDFFVGLEIVEIYTTDKNCYFSIQGGISFKNMTYSRKASQSNWKLEEVSHLSLRVVASYE